MNNVVNFETKKKEMETENYNTKEVQIDIRKEIEDRKKKLEEYGKDEMIDVRDWDGDAWKSFFEKVAVPYAEQYDIDPWDFMAVIIPKFVGECED